MINLFAYGCLQTYVVVNAQERVIVIHNTRKNAGTVTYIQLINIVVINIITCLVHPTLFVVYSH